jgi:uracil-DNA glycosylase family protein
MQHTMSKGTPTEAEPRRVEELLPRRRTLPALRDAAAGCRACDLWIRATQTVFGEGEPRARVVLVGEQPGDQEDRRGRPFVGPAGRLLDRALAEAGVDRSLVYVTNVVKHFKWRPQGKRRLHERPNRAEVTACLPWLEAEVAVLEPDILACLGATAAQALFGPAFRVGQHRGEVLNSRLGPTLVSVHPSSILRAPDEESRQAALAGFVEDLTKVRPHLRSQT